MTRHPRAASGASPAPIRRRATISSPARRAARGAPSPDDPEATRLWDGLSVYDTQAQARRTARRYRGLGAFLAAVDVPLDGRCRIERTLHRAGHHTVWGDADLLHAAVARVVSVAADEGSE